MAAANHHLCSKLSYKMTLALKGRQSKDVQHLVVTRI